MAQSSPQAPPAVSREGEYIVVARRYRPQGFADLVGQPMVSRALQNAIQTDRVGHAYLFTGARGVGKTSTARILSKALNCVQGPTPTPCHTCDICQSIATGDDVDVLEIDGASNRGIEEIRQLRSNVGVLPSRGRFKIYIIDEVHMLTREAFNALLKTLEEPPEHVKFIFCTTDPEKIPITVLSRCQRFDFSPVEASEIVGRLRQIVESEGAEADDQALEILARRAAGSMRDSQSLLEQLLSFAEGRITADTVHGMLGTADSASLRKLLDALAVHDAGRALAELDASLHSGVDAGQLAEQLLGALRDVMAVAVGGDQRLLLHTSPADFDELRTQAQNWGMETLLATLQILDQAISRMRHSMHARVLLETALVRIANLRDLDLLAELISQVRSGLPLSAPAAESGAKKKVIPVAKSPPVEQEAVALNPPDENLVDQDQQQPFRHSSTDSRLVSHDRLPPVATTTEPLPKAAAGAFPSVDGATASAEPCAAQQPDNAHPRSAVLSPATRPGPPQDVSSETAEADLDGGLDGDLEADLDGAGGPRAEEGAAEIWRKAMARLEGMTADCAAHYESVANSAPNRLVVTFPSTYNSSKMFCERPDRRDELQQAVSQAAGRAMKLEFSLREDPGHRTLSGPSRSTRQLQHDMTARPLVQKAIQLFSAEVVSVVLPRGE